MPLAATKNADQVYWHSAALFISDNVATQIDGLAHITAGPDDHWYNGFKEAEWGGDWGPRKCDGPTIPPIVARGVLIDVAAFKKVDALPGHTLITTKDLQDTLAWERVTLRPGDVVLVRTGTARFWGEDGADHATLAEHDTAGPDLDRDAMAGRGPGGRSWSAPTPADTRSTRRPAHPDTGIPVHRYLLVDQGVHHRRVPQPRRAQQGEGLHILLRCRGQQDQGDRRRLRDASARAALTGAERALRPSKPSRTENGSDLRGAYPHSEGSSPNLVPDRASRLR